jgi:mono/diheme cytochrome c family protein
VRGPHLAWALLAVVTLAGCRQDMQNQPRYKPLAESDFFADRRSERPLVEGTVARGALRTDDLFYTGKQGGKDADLFPFPVTGDVLRRGRERFDIYCSPCHGRTGEGDGMVVQRGFRRPPSYHKPELVQAPVGHFFDVMTHGWGAMPDYASQVPVRDRWAIAAYIRVLQHTYVPLADLPPAEQDRVRNAGKQ